MMRREKKGAEPEEGAGAPTWMVTFSDCMTLLLTFFVLLLSFSSFDRNDFRKLKVIFARSFSGVSPKVARDKTAFLAAKLVKHGREIEKGSEKPTLATGTKSNLKKPTEPQKFRDRKIFLISSTSIFWGKGTVISFQGRRILSTMASFLKELPNRIVISEDGQDSEKTGEHFGLHRAWAVIDYLTTNYGLDRGRFSISAVSTVAWAVNRQKGEAKFLPEESTKNGEPAYQRTKPERMVEIVLLERSIYR